MTFEESSAQSGPPWALTTILLILDLGGQRADGSGTSGHGLLQPDQPSQELCLPSPQEITTPSSDSIGGR